MSGSGKWSDLAPRIASAVGMLVVGAFCIWLGGWWFIGLASIGAGLMVWELAAMLAPGQSAVARGLGLLGGVAVLIASQIAGWSGILFLLVPVLAGLLVVPKDKAIFAGYGLAILIAAWGLPIFRAEYGVVWLVWLVLVVIATDVSGYFAGRLLGGPKFWPRFSPKKTWSGTVAGWIAAALVGLIFRSFTTAGPDLPWISAGIAFASQMGDITESAIKRHAGVKDSSHLIPGHGGLLDRFDGLLGAALLMLLVALIVVVPEVRL